ncbi:MAG: GxxExxY protein [Candidatus Hydrogenedentes bacterium]|nr:GxxExxY protein [Candidatus Hydrogenedentota bacterium]
MSNQDMKDCPDSLCERVIGAAIAVHRELGPGLLESVYEKALMFELQDQGIQTRNQVDVPLFYRGNDLGTAFRADLVLEDCLLLELKSVSELTDLHLAQIMSYQRLLNFKRGYLLNFNVRRMIDGVKRVSI